MSFLDNKNKKKSFVLTVFILIALLAWMFYFGMTHFDPPIENGIAVTLGYADEGSGNNNSPEKVKMAPQEASQPQPQQPVEEQPEEVITSDAEDVPVMPDTKTEKPVTKPTEKPKEQVKPDPKPSKETSNALNSIISGKEQNGIDDEGNGDDKQGGKKGDPDGDPYAASFFGKGNGTGGRGYGLKGRGTPSFTKKKQDCNESGTVVVKIVVNPAGNVIETTSGVQGTTNAAQCLTDTAEEIAKTYKWPADSKAPARQTGFVVITFNLGE